MFHSQVTKQGAAAATGVRQEEIDVEETSTGVSCPVGEQRVIKLDKKGTEIERSECGNIKNDLFCAICGKHTKL